MFSWRNKKNINTFCLKKETRNVFPPEKLKHKLLTPEMRNGVTLYALSIILRMAGA